MQPAPYPILPGCWLRIFLGFENAFLFRWIWIDEYPCLFPARQIFHLYLQFVWCKGRIHPQLSYWKIDCYLMLFRISQSSFVSTIFPSTPKYLAHCRRPVTFPTDCWGLSTSCMFLILLHQDYSMFISLSYGLSRVIVLIFWSSSPLYFSIWTYSSSWHTLAL